MGLFDRFKGKRASNEVVPSMPSNDHKRSSASFDTTSMEREHFVLQAPFEWRAVPPERPLEFEFHNNTLPEQLIITVLLAREPIEPSQLNQVAQRLSEQRREVVLRVSGGQAVISPTTFQTASGQAEARCIAIDHANNVQYAWVIRVAIAKIITAALTRYTTEDLGTPFSAYTGTIFDFLQVKNPTTVTGFAGAEKAEF